MFYGNIVFWLLEKFSKDTPHPRGELVLSYVEYVRTKLPQWPSCGNIMTHHWDLLRNATDAFHTRHTCPRGLTCLNRTNCVAVWVGNA